MNSIPGLFDSATAILACPMCMGGADDNTAIAANSAIGVMLLLLVVVLGSFLRFIAYLAKQAKAAESES